MRLPEPVDASLGASLAAYWRDRLRQHTTDTYRDRILAKFPEDLRVYQHIIWATQPRCIVELGTLDGGSALWFADQLQALVARSGVFVITVDRDPMRSVAMPGLVWQLEGDLADAAIAAAVLELTGGAERVMVVEDAAHTYECTRAGLTLYSELVSEGCYYVVEDAVVDEAPLALPEWQGCGGVRQAIDEFLEGHPDFAREDLAAYGLTTNHGGWLRRLDRGDDA